MFFDLAEIPAKFSPRNIGSFRRGWLSFRVKWLAHSAEATEDGEFRYHRCNTRIRSYRGKWSMLGNGASRSKGCCCLLGFAINPPRRSRFRAYARFTGTASITRGFVIAADPAGCCVRNIFRRKREREREARVTRIRGIRKEFEIPAGICIGERNFYACTQSFR